MYLFQFQSPAENLNSGKCKICMDEDLASMNATVDEVGVSM